MKPELERRRQQLFLLCGEMKHKRINRTFYYFVFKHNCVIFGADRRKKMGKSYVDYIEESETLLWDFDLQLRVTRLR